MMVTLTKLLVIRMVAKVRSESSLSIFILASFALLDASNSAMSVGERLKKAISDPLANAEPTNSIIVRMLAMITPTDG